MIRRSAAPILACLLLAGCGIQLRTPPAPEVPVAPVAVQARPNPVLPPPPVDPLVLEPGQTVVTLAFDDGWASTARAAQIMNAYGLRATFFISSTDIGKPNYLTLADLDWIATTSGNEIAGHAIHHPDAPAADQVKREVCADRATLMSWGFPVRNFAYPFTFNPAIRQIVGECGYNSARSLGDLRTVHVPENASPEQNCSECDWAETVPPGDPLYVRAPGEVRNNWTMPEFQQQIGNAEGGWVQITFQGICPADCSTTEATFTEFVIWLADQQAQGNLIVRTVGEVIGGPVAPMPTRIP